MRHTIRRSYPEGFRVNFLGLNPKNY